MTKKKVMITGAAGFVGSHLAARLLQDGVEVHAFDVVPLAAARNLAEVAEAPGFYYYQGDLLDKDFLGQFYQKDADAIYHLASVVGVKHYMENPLKLIDVIVVGTRNLLDIAVQYNTRFIFSSTSEVFGKNPNVPWAEEDDRVLGNTSIDRWSYSSSKAVCEHMLYALHRAKQFPFNIVRFFNAYGPRQNPIYAVSKTAYHVLRGEAPLVYDGGQQTRCFTYIDDIVEGLVNVGLQYEGVAESFNLGRPVESSLSEVVDTIIRLAGSDVVPESLNTRSHYGNVYEDIVRRIPDASKAKRELGWEATTTLEAGLSKTLAWASENPWWLNKAEEVAGAVDA